VNGVIQSPTTVEKEESMNANKVTFALTALLLAVAPNLHAAKCSNASLKGIYAYSSQGFAEVTPDISPAGFVPFAQTGLVTYDGRGNVVSGTFTDSTTTANGGSFQGTFTGTYAVNGDCTGKLQIDLGDGTLFHFDLVIQGSTRHTAINTDSGTFMSVFSIQKIRGEDDTAETK
jgi:hypothetical protein